MRKKQKNKQLQTDRQLCQGPGLRASEHSNIKRKPNRKKIPKIYNKNNRSVKQITIKGGNTKLATARRTKESPRNSNLPTEPPIQDHHPATETIFATFGFFLLACCFTDGQCCRSARSSAELFGIWQTNFN